VAEAGLTQADVLADPASAAKGGKKGTPPTKGSGRGAATRSRPAGDSEGEAKREKPKSLAELHASRRQRIKQMFPDS
jgi:hypothetical protein